MAEKPKKDKDKSADELFDEDFADIQAELEAEEKAIKDKPVQEEAESPESPVKEEVVEAVTAGNFHVYPISTIDEGIEVLTGLEAGQRLEDGSFEPDSINDRVQERLVALAERLRDFTKGAEEGQEPIPPARDESES